MKRVSKKLLTCMLALTMLISVAVPVIPSNTIVVHAKTRITISSKSEYLLVGDTVKLKVKGTSKKVMWASTNKRVATVSKSGLVKAKNEGRATIVAKVSGKKLKCKVTVYEDDEEEDEDDGDDDDDDVVVPTPTPKPTTEAEIQAKNMQYLVKMITTNGIYDSEKNVYNYVGGNRYDEFGAMISYYPSQNKMEFVFLSTKYNTVDSDLALTMTTTTNSDIIKSGNAEFLWIIKDDGAALKATATIDAANYKDADDVNFHIETSVRMWTISDSDIEELTNKTFKAAMLSWEIILGDEAGMSMRDIGFTSYSYDN